MINEDILIEKGEIKKWVEWMDAHPEIALSGCRQETPEGELILSQGREMSGTNSLAYALAVGRPRERKTRYSSANEYLVEHDAEWSNGSVMLVRRSAFELCDGFREKDFFLFFEEVDLQKRLRKIGFRVTYWPKISVFRTPSPRSREARLIWFRSRLRYGELWLDGLEEKKWHLSMILNELRQNDRNFQIIWISAKRFFHIIHGHNTKVLDSSQVFRSNYSSL